MTLEQTSGTHYRKGRGSLSNRESRYLHRQSSLLESAQPVSRQNNGYCHMPTYQAAGIVEVK